MSDYYYATRYKDWVEKYDWNTCKAQREEYGKFLCSFLTQSLDSLVVNMNGSWGTGKTELLRRIYIELAKQEHPVVYIDAWESDFSKDALSVVCSELIEQIGNIFKVPSSDKEGLFSAAQESLKNVSNLLGSCLKFTKSAANVLNQPQLAAVTQGAEPTRKCLRRFAFVSAQKPAAGNKYKKGYMFRDSSQYLNS